MASATNLLPEETPAKPCTENIQVNNTSAATIEELSPEFLQRKLYFLLEHLKKMHGELPE